MTKNNIAFMWQVVAQYCLRYLDKKDGDTICNYFMNKYTPLMWAMRNAAYLDAELPAKMEFIFSKIKADVFEHKLRTYHINMPYDHTDIEEIDFKTFCLECHDIYESFNKEHSNGKGIIMLGVESKILDLLLPPKDTRLFNAMVAKNKFAMNAEHLHSRLRRQGADVIEHYGRSFHQLTKDEFTDYIDKNIEKTPQHLSQCLWYLLRAE